MERLIEISAVVVGVVVFVLLAVISWAWAPKRRSPGAADRFVPGNYHPDDHHHAADGWGGHDS